MLFMENHSKNGVRESDRSIQVETVKINQSVFTSLVLGLLCDSEARTAIVSDGQHIGTSQELQALNALRELLGILQYTYLVVFASQM
jgi:hypothetical protein